MQVNENIDPAAMSAAADETAALLRTISNPHRVMILCQLTTGEKSVGQLAGFIGIRDSTTSQHLAVLRRARIIAGRRDGQTIWYRIVNPTAREIMQVLYAAYCGKGGSARMGSPA